MSETKNDKSYWENRFQTDWETNFGSEQTTVFSHLFYSNLPQGFIDEINENHYSIVDLGMAHGDTVPFFKSKFKKSKISGTDFSATAVTRAKEKHPGYDFFESDITKDKYDADILYCSNVLEHFHSPLDTLKHLETSDSKYICLLLPYQDPVSDEHFFEFNNDTIPCVLDSHSLVYFRRFYVNSEHVWCGFQILLIYAKKDTKSNKLEYFDEYTGILSYMQTKTQELELTLHQTRENAQKSDEEIHRLNNVIDAGAQELEKLSDRYSKCEGELKYYKARENDLLYEMYQKNDIINALQGRTVVRIANKYNAICEKYRFLRFCTRVTMKILKLPYRLLKRLRGNRKPIEPDEYNADIAEKILSETKGKRVIVFLPVIDWSVKLFQRPQQLAKAYSNKENTVVIYFSLKKSNDSFGFATKVLPHCWLVDARYMDKINAIIKESEEVIVTNNWTENHHYLEQINHSDYIYEYIDELSIFPDYSDKMVEEHEKTLKTASLTVATATRLYEEVKNTASDLVLSTNGGDYEFFSGAKKCSVNPMISDKVKDYKVVIGYYGCLASWFDYEIAKKIAKAHPDWAWLLIGINYDDTLYKSGLLEFENVIYIPPQPYEALPSFLAAFTIASIPFLINDITLSTSPVKLFEYMAASKPVISSKMPECLKYESVKTYDTADEFITLVEQFIAMKPEDAYFELLEKEALENTWDAKTDEILFALEESKRKRKVRS